MSVSVSGVSCASLSLSAASDPTALASALRLGAASAQVTPSTWSMSGKSGSDGFLQMSGLGDVVIRTVGSDGDVMAPNSRGSGCSTRCGVRCGSSFSIDGVRAEEERVEEELF